MPARPACPVADGHADRCSAGRSDVHPVSASISVEAGIVTVFTASAVVNPAPTAVQRQVRTDGGGHWSNMTDCSTYYGSTLYTSTSTGFLSSLVITTTNTSLTNNQYRVVYSNAVQPSGVPSIAATLTVLPTEALVADWNFNLDAQILTNGPTPNITNGVAGAALRRGHAPSIERGRLRDRNRRQPLHPGDDITNTPSNLSKFNQNTYASAVADGGHRRHSRQRLEQPRSRIHSRLTDHRPTTDYSHVRSPWTGTPLLPAKSTPRSSTRLAENTRRHHRRSSQRQRHRHHHRRQQLQVRR